jgi:hypothetical protein
MTESLNTIQKTCKCYWRHSTGAVLSSPQQILLRIWLIVCLLSLFSRFYCNPAVQIPGNNSETDHCTSTFLTCSSSSYVPELRHSMMFNTHNFKASLEDLKKWSGPVVKTNSLFPLCLTWVSKFCLHSTRLINLGGGGNYYPPPTEKDIRIPKIRVFRIRTSKLE